MIFVRKEIKPLYYNSTCQRIAADNRWNSLIAKIGVSGDGTINDKRYHNIMGTLQGHYSKNLHAHFLDPFI